MKDNIDGFIIGGVTGILISVFFVLFYVHDNRLTQEYLIEKNYAYYHPQTGEFTLKECKE